MVYFDVDMHMCCYHRKANSDFKIQDLFVAYTIIQDIANSEM